MSINSNSTAKENNKSEVKEISLAEIYFTQAEELRCNSQFKEAIDKGNEKKFLSTLGKIDKISLLNHLGINVPEEKKKGLNKVQIKYYKALTDSIKDSQVDDKRDGIDSFLTYKRNKA